MPTLKIELIEDLITFLDFSARISGVKNLIVITGFSGIIKIFNVKIFVKNTIRALFKNLEYKENFT